MELANPSLNPPALQPTLVKRFSHHSRGHSRSPSHSPVRPYSPLSFDPLLRSLSPSATLYAFSRTHPGFEDSRSPSPRRRELKTSVAKVSDDQRELGTRAAQACLDIRGWTRELASWHWPGCFEEPEPARKKARISMMSVGSSASATTNGTAEHDAEDKERWLGSLPASTVEEFDKRCQEVAAGLDEIEMEELKDFALKAHHHEGQSIAERLDSNDPDRKDLDDFTAVVTATVLQTLPYLSELNRLLDTWTIRLAILKQVPSFLAEMDRLRRDLDHGWAAIAVSLRKTGGNASLESRNMDEMQGLIDARMTALGSTLDGFLDMLEGQEDTVPDVFLDKFEELEQRYAEWVVTAQQRVLGDELKTFEQSSSPISPTALLLNTDGLDRSKTPTLRDFDRARTPTILDSDGVRSPVLYEFERAKTPVIHEVDRAKTPIMDSLVAPVSDAAAEFDDGDDALEPNRDDLVRETRKSLLLRLSQDASTLPRLIDGTNEDSDQGILSQPSMSNEHRAEKGGPVQSSPPSKPEPQDVSVRSTASTDSGLRSSPNNSSVRPSADTILPAHDASPTVKSRKGSILGRLFKRNKSSELKREASVTSEPAERVGRPESSSSLIRAARRSFSRKRTSKRELEPVWNGRATSPDTKAKYLVSNGDASQPRHSRRSLQVDRPSTMQHTTRGAGSEEVQRPATASAHTQSVRPLTYQPKGLQQRPISMTQPQFPDNWPLPENAQAGATADMTGSNSGGIAENDVAEINLRTVRSMGAMNSDNFLDVFIGGFPATPTASKAKQADIAFARLHEGEQPAAARSSEDKNESLRTATPSEPDGRVPVPVVTSSMLSSEGRQDDLSVARAIGIDGLRKFDSSPARYYSDKEVNVKYMIDKRDTSLPIAVAVDYADSSSAAQRSREDSHPAGLQALPQLPGQQHVDAAPVIEEVLTSSLPPQEMSAEPAHKVLLAVDTSAQHSRQISADATDDESGTDYKNLLKRASTASIKAHAASELRSIDVPARKRDSSRLAHSQPSSEVPSPTVQSPVTQTAQADSTPGSRRSSITQFNRPGYSRSNSRNGTQSPTGSMDTPNFSRLRSSSVDTDDHRATPLSITVAKRRLREAPGLSTISPSAEYAESPSSALETKPVRGTTRAAPADNFDRHVSEVLESLPAPIRFRNRAGDDISSGQTSTARSAAKSLRPRSTLAQRQSSGSGLTLAPAEATPRRCAPSDPEIKLYHLTQTGRDEPIKLFVRLVGEGERVMVRVGGGWSDLADFLRQYAEHHGSRTVSGSINGLELQTAENSPAGSRRTSGAVPTLADKRGRPTSRDGGITAAPVTTTSAVTSPVSVIEGIIELPGSEPQSAITPTSPTSGKLRKLDRKKSKDALSDQKARWVTRMLEKAKRETAPSKNNKDGSFGSMGRIGSTKRVFFSSPGSKSEQNGTKKR